MTMASMDNTDNNNDNNDTDYSNDNNGRDNRQVVKNDIQDRRSQTFLLSLLTFGLWKY